MTTPQPPAPPEPAQRQGLSQLTIGLITVGACLALFGAILFAALLNRNADTKIDIKVTSCEFTDGALPTATVGYTVTNRDDRTRDVRLDIEYRDNAGARLDTDTAYVRDVAPGDTVRGEESTILDAGASDGDCLIVDFN